MDFNKKIEPFYWVDHGDAAASVCLTVCTINTDTYKEEVFKMHGDKGFVGSGYDWAALADLFIRKNMPELRGDMEFDPEHSMFCVYSSDKDALRKFALSFKNACEDDNYIKDLCSQVGAEYDLLTKLRPNSLLEIMRTGINVPNVILRGNWDGANAALRKKCIDNKLFELSGAVLDQHDLSKWMDVLKAPVFDFYPNGYNISIELHGVSEQRVADFAELLRGWEIQELSQEQQLSMDSQTMQGL